MHFSEESDGVKSKVVFLKESDGVKRKRFHFKKERMYFDYKDGVKKKTLHQVAKRMTLPKKIKCISTIKYSVRNIYREIKAILVLKI